MSAKFWHNLILPDAFIHVNSYSSAHWKRPQNSWKCAKCIASEGIQLLQLINQTVADIIQYLVYRLVNETVRPRPRPRPESVWPRPRLKSCYKWDRDQKLRDRDQYDQFSCT